MNALKLVFRRLLRNAVWAIKPKWPRYTACLASEPELLLLLSPPYSGTTAMAKFVAQSHSVEGLYKNFEGHNLVKGLKDPQRWKPELFVDYQSVKSAWHRRALWLSLRNPALGYIFEKSPPNMVRYKSLLGLFKRGRVVISIRNPYASISSIVYRTYDDEVLCGAERQEVFRRHAEEWLGRAECLMGIREDEGYPLVSYESFCDRPKIIFEKFGLEQELAEGIDSNFDVKVKDYQSQGIINMNERQVQKLLLGDIYSINQVLKGSKDVMAYFGYLYLDGLEE
jgi:hypothetical protein